jgi:inner membrane protein
LDSISQAVLGAAVAGAVAGKQCNGRVLAAGALLGTLPDLDVFINYGNDLANTVNHRGFSHSLLVLLPFSVLLTWLLRRHQKLAAQWSYRKLFALIALALMTHPLLDSLTTYGTHLFWPLDRPSVMVSSIFIIDLLYTVPLIVAVIWAIFGRYKGFACYCGLAVSTGYLLWTLIAQQLMISRVEGQLAATELEGRPLFVTPTPFNSLLWRVLILGDEQYWEGASSFFDDDSVISFVAYDRGLPPPQAQFSSLAVFDRFAHGFVSYGVEDNYFKATDLRLGIAEENPFAFYLARYQHGQWQEIEPVNAPRERSGFEVLPKLWQRMLGDQTIAPALR